MDDTVGPVVDEVEVARVDAEPGGLADDEHRVEPVDRVRQQRHAAAHREEPEVARHDALLRALRRDPLDQKAREERLAEQTDAEPRSEEHTSELQSPCNLVCRLLLEKK